jgi:tetratricopeptide (TPR) repeat protein
LVLLLCSPLAAQAPPAPAAPPPAAPQPAPQQPAVTAALAAAQARFEAGDLSGAIAALEPLRSMPDAPAPAISLLGGLYVEAGRHAEALALLGPLADREDANPAVLYNASRAARAAGQTAKARGYLERAARLIPVSPAGRDLGLLLAQEGRAAEAYQLLHPWSLAYPDDLDNRLAAALLALQLNEIAAAQELLAGAPETDPKVLLLRGKLLVTTGDPRGALALLEPIKDQHPPEIDADLRRLLATAYLGTGDSTSAIALLEKAKLDDPGMVLLLAEALYQHGEVERALAALQPLAEAVRDQKREFARAEARRVAGAVARAYGRMLVAAGRHGEAVAMLAKATQLLPDDVEAWQSYGQALVGAGRRDDAQQAFTRFTELAAAAREKLAAPSAAAAAPTDPELQQARKLMELGHHEKALEIARAEMAQAPGDLWPRVMAVRLLLILRRPEEALAIAQEMLRLAPDNPDAVYQRGVTYLALQKLPEAESDLRRALQLAPTHVPAMNDLAVLLMTRGENGEAKELLEKVLQLSPGDGMAARNLEKIRGKEGTGGK